MPITTRIPIRRLSQAEFGDIAYEVMLDVFAIHNEIGRFFEERITGFERSLDEFETHARRLLSHVDLHAVAWVNITMKQVTFTTLTQ